MVTSPATITTPVLIRVSQATRPRGSTARMASSTASEIWSATLSGWPSDTDSEVNRKLLAMRDPGGWWGVEGHIITAVDRGIMLGAYPIEFARPAVDNARPLHAACRTRRRPMPTRRELANVIRVLAMDAVQQANSGHPGAPMGMADMAEVLWREFLKHNPANPRWWNRDRFVLSNGHASMMLYAVLHLRGYPLVDGRDTSFPPARQPHRRDTRNTTWRLASRPRPGRSARGWPTRWAWRSPKKCWPRSLTGPTSRSSITTPVCSSATVA